MNEREKVAMWLWLKWIDAGEPDIAALEADGDLDWADCISDAKELLALREPSEPVAWVPDDSFNCDADEWQITCYRKQHPDGRNIALYLNPPSRDREALEGVTVYQCTNGDLYILTNENLVGAVHHFYQPFPEHAEQFGPLKPLTILGAEDER